MRAWLRRYAPLVVGVPGCLAAGWFELDRALAGRGIAWVYAFEWPMYAVVGTYVWWRVWHPADPDAAPHRSADDLPVAADPELMAWQGYLARLQRDDPPGGPPSR